MIALAGTTIERNTTISRMKLSPSTKMKMIGVYFDVTANESTFTAVWPVT